MYVTRQADQALHDRYIHGFSQAEQDRLIRQAVSLEPYVFTNINYSNCHHILEVGCGVGAQIKRLLQDWPNLKVTGVDIKETQICRAKEFLKSEVESDRVELQVCDGEKLPFDNDTFEGAFMCWVLEHVENPLKILSELKRVMKPGTPLYCTEVFNSGLYTDPPCSAMRTYWEKFNHYQRQLGGDPDVGIKLCNIALNADFSGVSLRNVSAHLDRRLTNRTERKAFLDYFETLLLTAAPTLLAEGKISSELIREMQTEFISFLENLNSVFVYMFFQLKAVK